MPLVSSPLSVPPYRARSKLRLLLSVWRAGCENVATICVCFPQCMCASPSSKLRVRQRTSALNSPLTPPPSPCLPCLSLSFSPSITRPSLPFLSWHQHSRNQCQNTRQGCQDTWWLLNREKSEKTADFYLWRSHGPNCHFAALWWCMRSQIQGKHKGENLRDKPKKLEKEDLFHPELESHGVWLLVAVIWNESGRQKGLKICTVTQETLLQTFTSSEKWRVGDMQRKSIIIL